MHYVIIGNSAAGINAAETLRNLDKSAKITIISNENTAPYSRCLLSYYLAGEIPKKRLFIRDNNWYQDLNITPLLGRRVVSLRPKQNLVILDDRNKLSYNKLLIASGSSPLFIPIKGCTASGVFGFRTLEDANNIIRFMSARGGKSVQSVAIIGAGFIGLKTAYGFWKRGVKVTVVEKLNRLMPRMIDQKASDIFQQMFKSKGIDVLLCQGVQEIISHDGHVVGVKLENGKTIPCQMVIMSVGVKPNIDFLSNSGIRTNQGIIVNEHLETNIKNIFAAGDVAETIDFVSGEQTINALWPCASAQGKIAAYNMVGQKRVYQGSMAMNSVEFFGLPVISFGIVNPPNNGYKIITNVPPKRSRRSGIPTYSGDPDVPLTGSRSIGISGINSPQKIYQKIILRENQLVGLIAVGKIEKAGVYLSLLKRGDGINPYALKNERTEKRKNQFFGSFVF